MLVKRTILALAVLAAGLCLSCYFTLHGEDGNRKIDISATQGAGLALPVIARRRRGKPNFLRSLFFARPRPVVLYVYKTGAKQVTVVIDGTVSAVDAAIQFRAVVTEDTPDSDNWAAQQAPDSYALGATSVAGQSRLVLGYSMLADAIDPGKVLIYVSDATLGRSTFVEGVLPSGMAFPILPSEP